MAFVPKQEILVTSRAKVSTNTVFDASAKTLTINDIDFQEALFAVNVTDGIIIFDPAAPSTTATRDGTVLRLNFDTSSMSDGDDILVLYEPDSASEQTALETQIGITEVVDELKGLRQDFEVNEDNVFIKGQNREGGPSFIASVNSDGCIGVRDLSVEAAVDKNTVATTAAPLQLIAPIEFGTNTTDRLLSEILVCLDEIKIQMSLITGFGTEESQ